MSLARLLGLSSHVQQAENHHRRRSKRPTEPLPPEAYGPHLHHRAGDRAGWLGAIYDPRSAQGDVGRSLGLRSGENLALRRHHNLPPPRHHRRRGRHSDDDSDHGCYTHDGRRSSRVRVIPYAGEEHEHQTHHVPAAYTGRRHPHRTAWSRRQLDDLLRGGNHPTRGNRRRRPHQQYYDPNFDPYYEDFSPDYDYSGSDDDPFSDADSDDDSAYSLDAHRHHRHRYPRSRRHRRGHRMLEFDGSDPRRAIGRTRLEERALENEAEVDRQERGSWDRRRPSGGTEVSW